MNPTAVAVIRSAALHHNLRQVRQAAPGCRVLAVIKANAYGHGLLSVARVLAGADGFAVARIEEALQLREAGIGQRVVVLGGFVSREELGLACRYRLDMVVHSLAQIEALEAWPEPPGLDLWLKVDTGMGRLGIDPDDVAASVARLTPLLAGRARLRLMTHLACADDAGSPATAAQLASFAKLRAQWSGAISIANSAGILQWPEAVAAGAVTNWVRPGLMLYGVSPLAGRTAQSLELKPAMSFETRLIAVRHMKRGQRVGYGGEWIAPRDSLVGVAAAGYADGYPWHSAQSTAVLIHGARAAVLGRVSMDMISIDLTEVAARAAVRPGDRVTLWGEGLPVEEVAGWAGTIPYELLAGMSPRVLRQLDED